MPLPYRSDKRRKVSRWFTADVADPSFEPKTEPVMGEDGQPVLGEDGQPETREVWGTAPVAMRALLDTEIDIADGQAAAFVAKHLDGNWIDEDGKLQERPIPVLIDAKAVPLDADIVRRMHRYEAMQKPMPGMPAPPNGAEVHTVADLVEATVVAEDFWKGVQVHAAKVWREGRSGKAWAATVSDGPPSA